eukprot:6181769-Pleurochrysis_carterae.AAC.3
MHSVRALSAFYAFAGRKYACSCNTCSLARVYSLTASTPAHTAHLPSAISTWKLSNAASAVECTAATLSMCIRAGTGTAWHSHHALRAQHMSLHRPSFLSANAPHEGDTSTVSCYSRGHAIATV